MGGAWGIRIIRRGGPSLSEAYKYTCRKGEDVFFLDFIGDGRFVATASMARVADPNSPQTNYRGWVGSIQLWDSSKGKGQTLYHGRMDLSTKVRVSSDRASLTVLNSFGSGKYDLVSGEFNAFEGVTIPVHADRAISKDGAKVAWATKKGLTFVDTESGKHYHLSSSDRVGEFDIHGDSDQVSMVRYDQKGNAEVAIWNPYVEAFETRIGIGRTTVSTVVGSRDGTKLAVATIDNVIQNGPNNFMIIGGGRIIVIDLKSGQSWAIQSSEYLMNPVFTFSADGRTLTVLNQRLVRKMGQNLPLLSLLRKDEWVNEFEMWDIASKSKRDIFRWKSSRTPPWKIPRAPSTVALSENGEFIGVGTNDGTVTVLGITVD